MRKIVMRNLHRQTAFFVLATAVLGAPCLIPNSARAQGVVLPLPAEDRQMITAKLGTIVDKALPSKPIEDVSVYFPLQEKTAIYQVTAGPTPETRKHLASRRPNAQAGNRPGGFSFRPRSLGLSIRHRRVIS